MNVLTQIATQFLVNKNTLLQLFKTLDFPDDFLNEFRHDRISIDEDLIRRKLQQLTQDQSFQDLFCHEDGIHFVFHINFHDLSFIRFRICFDIKIIALILNNHHQTIQLMINNIEIKPLNRLAKPFRYCIRSKARVLVIEELERICTEQKIPYERLFTDIKRPLTYEINLINIKELDQLRQRFLLIGNQTILDLIQITYVEHREQSVILGYRLNTMSNPEPTTIQFEDNC